MRVVGRLIQGFGMAGLMVLAAPVLLWQLFLLLMGGVLGATLLNLLLMATLFPWLGMSGPAETVKLLLFGAVYLMGLATPLMLWADMTGLTSVFRGRDRESHGSARFATRKERAGFAGGEGLLIGRDLESGKLLRYDGPAHLLTLAPTRAGKGVGTVIPNLLTAERSVLVIDPKGENARIAGAARERFGAVHVLDPFGVTGLAGAAYNPLGQLTAESPDLGEDAASLAEALVMDPPGQVSEAHWNEEAKALLGGLIMFAVAHEEAGRKTLASVREYLTLPPEKFRALVELMQESDAAGGLIARAANRFLGKSDKEAASVLSSAQRHTHFLDSPRIVTTTARSDFQFRDLRHRITSVFLVLPPNRLDAYSRWLRLLVSQALQDIARDAEGLVATQGTP